MTLDEALLYDAEWWTRHDMTSLDIQTQCLVSDIRSNWGVNETAEGKDMIDFDDYEVESYFNLLIREAIRND